MGRKGTGVEARENSIRLTFTLDGKTYKETIKVSGKPLAPTPANLKYAARLAAEIKDKIKHGTFNFAEYFPASRNATTGAGTTTGEQLSYWLGLQTGMAKSTLKGYRIAVDFWKSRIGDVNIRMLTKGKILEALATEPTWTGKTVNNKMSVLRQALELAVDDRMLTESPVSLIKPSKHQRALPDPFSLEEVELILQDLHKHYAPQIALYFEFKFFTGLRTSESLALRWGSVDWRLDHFVVSEVIVLGEHEDRTKTNTARTVSLNSRSRQALQAMKAHSLMSSKDGFIFLDPRTGERFTDDEPPREMYWRPALRRLGIRYRSPYETRHTYATIMLMSGVTPAFAAKQMGHTIQMFLTTYAKWIDGGQNAVEMGKLEGAIANSPLALPRKSENRSK